MELTRRHIKALEAFAYECDYEDSRVGGTDNFVDRNKLPPGIGYKTVSELVDWGLIVNGRQKFFDRVGYRITERGRRLLKGERP